MIFLGGTNDLGYGRDASDIFADIKKVLRMPLDHGARVVVMTVPECGVKSEKLDARRDELNGFIRGVVEVEESLYVFFSCFFSCCFLGRGSVLFLVLEDEWLDGWMF